GGGYVLVRAVDMEGSSKLSGAQMRGRVKHLKYFDGRRFIEAAVSGDLIQIPLGYFNFVNIGNDTMTRILHGSICLKMQCTVGEIHMPEST
ncbi:hypothetical protein, partial [Klebsiella pneumoniae]|uniref:hypothetical protein n=1 Tax=Klebsiella pneumoniae TaxID=573 RepID=UPI003AF98A5D